MSSAFRSTLALAVFLVLSGCRKPANRWAFPFCSAVGTVTLDGRPLESGAVSFVPTISERQGGRPGLCSIEADGAYAVGKSEFGRASPLPPGDYIVTVLAMTIDRRDGKPAPRVAVPERYTDYRTSPLRATLVAGENRIDVKLVR
jgi:hypothetical protein